MLEQAEGKLKQYERREKQVDNLALECRKAKEQSVLEKDRLLLREQQLRKRISVLEELKESSQTKERHRSTLEMVRAKHR